MVEFRSNLLTLPAARPTLAAVLFIGVSLALSACGSPARTVTPSVTAPSFDPSDTERLAAFVPAPKGEAARRPTSNDLLGLSADSVRGLFGTAGLVRREAPAEVWQYLSGRCSLLVYLYPDTTRPGALRVQHAETLARSRSASIADPDCISDLIKGTPPVS